jgi:hypothetical protein
VGLLILSVGQVGASLAVLGDIRASRRAAAAVAGLSAALSVAGALWIANQPVTNTMLAVALAATTLIFGVSAIVLARAPR